MSFVVIAAVTVATTGISAYGAYTEAKEAKKKRKEAEAETKRLEAKEKREEEQAAMRVAKRRGVATDKTRPRSTILTSPLGVPGGTQGGKTLLGQ